MTAYLAGAYQICRPVLLSPSIGSSSFLPPVIYAVQLSTSHIRIRSNTSFDICPSVLQTILRGSDAVTSWLCFLFHAFPVVESRRVKRHAAFLSPIPPFSIVILHIILTALSSH